MTAKANYGKEIISHGNTLPDAVVHDHVAEQMNKTRKRISMR